MFQNLQRDSTTCNSSDQFVDIDCIVDVLTILLRVDIKNVYAVKKCNICFKQIVEFNADL